MGAKVTKVKLRAESLDLTEAFGIEDAERILRLKNCQWKIADGNFEWKDNAIRRRANKERVEGAGQGTSNP